jgi:hypothetical protein
MRCECHLRRHRPVKTETGECFAATASVALQITSIATLRRGPSAAEWERPLRAGHRAFHRSHCRPALRPIEASKTVVCYVRFTSTPVISGAFFDLSDDTTGLLQGPSLRGPSDIWIRSEPDADFIPAASRAL